MPLEQWQQAILKLGTSQAGMKRSAQLGGPKDLIGGRGVPLTTGPWAGSEDPNNAAYTGPTSDARRTFLTMGGAAGVKPDVPDMSTRVPNRPQVPVGSGVSSTPLDTTASQKQNPKASRRLLGGSSASTLLGGL